MSQTRLSTVAGLILRELDKQGICTGSYLQTVIDRAGVPAAIGELLAAGRIISAGVNARGYSLGFRLTTYAERDRISGGPEMQTPLFDLSESD